MKKYVLGIVMAAFALAAGADSTANRYSVVKGARTSKPLTVYSSPNISATAGKVSLEEFAAWGALPVLEEQGSFIRIQPPAGQFVWILSEKVEVARAMECGGPTPESVIKVVKSESLAARGIGELCGARKK